ncbi:hypothetical protein HK44_011960 [Pseudomonas fluorescens HK44]|uniref:Uncharacterized protein n=1 Tax=Pseudomonas fluorescens HK44 TaxID=1042209 RepID=A0A010RTK0_PSEFL|nr:hypothetical protein HK44_011960 [Pseudomonas fluorescens HK44]
MTINLKLELASGQSLNGAPLELLANGVPVARAIVDDKGHVTFDAKLGVGKLFDPEDWLRLLRDGCRPFREQARTLDRRCTQILCTAKSQCASLLAMAVCQATNFLHVNSKTYPRCACASSWACRSRSRLLVRCRRMAARAASESWRAMAS